MPEANDLEPRLRMLETIVGNLVPEIRGELHKIFDKAEQAAEGVVTLKKAEKRERIDWPARVIALVALAIALVVCLYVCWHPGSIRQDVKQETRVERERTMSEHVDDYVRDATHVHQGDE